jgi:ABC-type nitrate/sulfonate/bicarbonate transport system permease component
MSRPLVALRKQTRATRVAASAIGAVAILAVWQWAGLAGPVGSVPSFTDTVAAFFAPNAATVLSTAIAVTLPRAASGFVFGIIVGILLALVPVFVRSAAATINRSAALLNALPVLVMAPILVTILGVDIVPVFMAALAAFFAVFVTMSSALSLPPHTPYEYFRATGSGKWSMFTLLRGPAALPALFQGLTLAAGAALGGAMFGEWFGTSTGLGVLLLSSVRNYQTDLLWATALCVTVLGICAYLAFAGIHLIVSRRFSE